MATVYSAYEAKTKLAEILRRVRAGASVTITYHGKPVAEVRAIGRGPTSLAERLEALGEQGRIVRRRGAGKLRPIARRSGGLGRFLAERE
jgi:antitoxin (DNA-binding transcriptional repressor) of toxin-antitoxin stability system